MKGFILTIVLLGVIIITCTSCAHYTVTEGDKVGVVTRVTREGLFCKTNEMQIIRGGMNNGSGSFGAPFEVTVPAGLLAKANDALNTQKEIKITYHQEMFRPCASGSLNNFLDTLVYKE